jgi:hypothetical protein
MDDQGISDQYHHNHHSIDHNYYSSYSNLQPTVQYDHFFRAAISSSKNNVTSKKNGSENFSSSSLQSSHFKIATTNFNERILNNRFTVTNANQNNSIREEDVNELSKLVQSCLSLDRHNSIKISNDINSSITTQNQSINDLFNIINSDNRTYLNAFINKQREYLRHKRRKEYLKSKIFGNIMNLLVIGILIAFSVIVIIQLVSVFISLDESKIEKALINKTKEFFQK